MSAKVETFRQAQRWDAIKSHYRKLGLCHRCAAQAAYGSQDGFSTVHPPCPDCLPIIATFPTVKTNGWRSLPLQGGRTGFGTPRKR